MRKETHVITMWMLVFLFLENLQEGRCTSFFCNFGQQAVWQKEHKWPLEHDRDLIHWLLVLHL